MLTKFRDRQIRLINAMTNPKANTVVKSSIRAAVSAVPLGSQVAIACAGAAACPDSRPCE
ncbi:Uncharacterised protein [Mycobacteroides abscessus subsp. massiliense]|nr:Uncharacterised protein [Mycobacteroides abscessus subsp. massiliense]